MANRTTVAICVGIRIMRLPEFRAMTILVAIVLSVLSLLSLHRPASLVAVLVLDLLLDLLVLLGKQ